MSCTVIQVGASGTTVLSEGPERTNLAPVANLSKVTGYVSPWVDAQKDLAGNWELPQYPCEIRGLPDEDPKNRTWTPGEYSMGVDNTDIDPETNKVREWGGQKMWEGDRPPADWERNLRKQPKHVQSLLKVPHMPGQPVKELFARMKALDPRPFEDKYFEEIHRDMPENWYGFFRMCQHAESFGVNTEQEPGEWAGQEDELVPAVYPTPRPDTVTICVGLSGFNPDNGDRRTWIDGVEYDYLKFLYARDQEGKVIQIQAFPNHGMTPALFCTYSFVPPLGTTSITPCASFKLRGAWQGTTIEWDPNVGSGDMAWFSEMAPEMRAVLAEKPKLRGKNKVEVETLKYQKSTKWAPVLFPENSWEGNAAKARMWDGMRE